MIEPATKTDLQATFADLEANIDKSVALLDGKIGRSVSLLDAKIETLSLKLTIRLGAIWAAGIALLVIQKLS